MVKKCFHFVSSKLRVNTAWRYKAPVLITVPYTIIYLSHTTPVTAIKYILLSFVTIIGIAGYAFLLNDWADIEKDSLAGKANAMASLSLPIRILLLALFFAIALVPWFVFPVNTIMLAILIAELILFAIYAFPPFRLKEKPVLGVATDALYAHVLPALLAALTFIEITAESTDAVGVFSYGPVLYSLCAWQFFLGIRNILLHQQDDYEKDIQSSTITFATRYPNAVDGIVKWMLVFEALAFILLAILTNALGIAIAVAYLIFFIRLIIINKQKAIPNTIRGKAYVLFDEFYYKWFPLAVLALLTIRQPGFGILALLHILLFHNAVKDIVKQRINR